MCFLPSVAGHGLGLLELALALGVDLGSLESLSRSRLPESCDASRLLNSVRGKAGARGRRRAGVHPGPAEADWWQGGCSEPPNNVPQGCGLCTG